MEALHSISHPDSRACSRLGLFEKRMLGRIFGPKRKWKDLEDKFLMQNFTLYNFHYISLGSREWNDFNVHYSWEREEIHRKFLSEDVNEGHSQRYIFSDGGLDSTGLGLVPVLKFHECGNEWSGSMKHVKFSDLLCKSCLIRKMCAPRTIIINEGRCISLTFKTYRMMNTYKGCYLSILQVHSVVPCICTTPDELCSSNWTKNSALLGDILQHTIPTAQAGHGCPSWFWIQCNGELGAHNFPVIVYHAIVDVHGFKYGPSNGFPDFRFIFFFHSPSQKVSASFHVVYNFYLLFILLVCAT